MSGTITISVAVSGTCSTCGVLNNASVSTSGPAGTAAVAVANASCGACQSPVALTGSAVIAGESCG